MGVEKGSREIRETQEIREEEIEHENPYSREALEQFEKLMEDDKIETEDYVNNSFYRLSREEAEAEFDKLFEDDEEDFSYNGVSEVEEQGKLGGRFADIRQVGEGSQYEVHHIPADSASYLERNDGPAIKMEKIDHRQTASCGNSKEAREYRDIQKSLIDEGKFREACQMDIDDIRKNLETSMKME